MRFHTICAGLLVVGAALGLSACSKAYEFDPVEVGTQDDERAPRPKTDRQFIRSVYGDLLGRAPAQFDLTFQDDQGNMTSFPIDEEEYLLFVMDGSADSDSMRELVVAGLVDSEEAAIPAKAEVADPSAYIADRFRELLGREPSTYELATFLDAWEADDAVGPRVVVRAITSSREYQSL